jgi:hypothetical protein
VGEGKRIKDVAKKTKWLKPDSLSRLFHRELRLPREEYKLFILFNYHLDIYLSSALFYLLFSF